MTDISAFSYNGTRGILGDHTVLIKIICVVIPSSSPVKISFPTRLPDIGAAARAEANPSAAARERRNLISRYSRANLHREYDIGLQAVQVV